MSISSSSINRFRARVDGILDAVFPVTLIIGEASVPASGPGGRTMTDFETGGQPETFRFPFRIKISDLPEGWSAQIGASIDWQVSESLTIPMEIKEVSIRPHEERIAILCKKRRVA